MIELADSGQYLPTCEGEISLHTCSNLQSTCYLLMLERSTCPILLRIENMKGARSSLLPSELRRNAPSVWPNPAAKNAKMTSQNERILALGVAAKRTTRTYIWSFILDILLFLVKMVLDHRSTGHMVETHVGWDAGPPHDTNHTFIYISPIHLSMWF